MHVHITETGKNKYSVYYVIKYGRTSVGINTGKSNAVKGKISF